MAEELKTNNMPNFKKNTSPAMKRTPYKMKGSPMQRNFGIGEKESPLKVAPVIIAAGISSLIGAGTSAAIASSKAKAAKRKEDERKRKEALAGAAEGISGEVGSKSRLA